MIFRSITGLFFYPMSKEWEQDFYDQNPLRGKKVMLSAFAFFFATMFVFLSFLFLGSLIWDS